MRLVAVDGGYWFARSAPRVTTTSTEQDVAPWQGDRLRAWKR